MTLRHPSVTSSARLVQILDQSRRHRLRDLLLVSTGLLGVVGGGLIMLLPGSVTIGAIGVLGGALLLAMRALSARLPEWVTIIGLGVVVAAAILARPIIEGDVAGSPFFVGVLTLLVVSTAPRRLLPAMIAAPLLVLVAMWVLVAPWSEPSRSQSLGWGLVLVQSALVAAATLLDLVIMLRLVDSAAADQLRESERVAQLSEAIQLENERLEAVVAERTAHLDEAVKWRDQLAADLREASTVDPGSGLSNQRRWEAQLPVILTEARERSMLVCVVVIDLDSFSEVNNRLGHPVGDQVIRRVAARLAGGIQDGTLLSRIGGEEFALAIPGVGERVAMERCLLLQAAVAAEPWAQIDDQLSPTFSAGIVEVSPDAVGDVSSVAREALNRADLAMQRAKREGRNRIRTAEPL